MKKALIPALMILWITMACSLTGRKVETQVPPVIEATIVEQPTEAPPTVEPTMPPLVETTEEILPTEEPIVEESDGYFIEEFDGDLSGWQPFVIAGDPKKDYARVVGERLKFEIPNTETYAYVENIETQFEDVYVEAEIETIKGGANGIALFCRGSDKGFYEFRIHTVGPYAGSFEVYRFDFTLRERKKVPYVNLLGGHARLNSIDIHAGFKTNTIGLMCVNDEIRLFINGVEQLPMPGGEPVRDDILTQGTIGVGAMSFSGGIVDVEIDSVSTLAP